MGRTESSAPGCAPCNEFDPATDDFVSKERNYTHFDVPLSEPERAGFSVTDTQLSQHEFWPLLGFTKIHRRLRFDRDRGRYWEAKPREIKFGSHRDAAVLEFYCQRLGKKYEAHLQQTKFGDSVLAYRSGVGDNVAQAGSLFREIRARENVIAIAMDIKGFFDNVDHEILFAALKKVLAAERLSDADHKVFKTMTRFAWVDSDALTERLGRRTAVGGRICSAREFREKVRNPKPGIVQANPDPFGIPQGTPLSGLYANISMLEFDRIIFNYIKKRGGTYRRYSDDIAIVIPETVDVALVLRHVGQRLKRCGLNLNPSKTEISHFRSISGVQSTKRAFQYLGFTFDGQRTLIRASSLNRYYAKMRRGIRAKVRAAREKGVPRDQIYMRELFRRYTHFGKNRNFPRYAYRASTILEAPEIRGQLSRHMQKFKSAVEYFVNRAYGPAVGSDDTKAI